MFNATTALISELENILGSENVYYEPPESIKLEYPCFIFKRETDKGRNADNIKYKVTSRYTITLVDFEPDSKFISPLMALPYVSHDNHYVSSGLHHDIFTIYW